MYKAYFIPRSDGDYEFVAMLSDDEQIVGDLYIELENAIMDILRQHNEHEVKILDCPDPETVSVLEV